MHICLLCFYPGVFVCAKFFRKKNKKFKTVLKIYENYVNSFEFIDNKWCLTIKNVFTTIRVVGGTGGSELKPQNDQFKVFLTL